LQGRLTGRQLDHQEKLRPVISPLNLLLVVSVTLAAFFDIRERRIPNWLTLPGTAIALLINILEGSAPLSQSLLGLAVAMGTMFVPFACGWLGAGDVKLLGLMGAIVGLQSLPRVMFYSTVVGGLLGVWALIARGAQASILMRCWADVKLAVLSLGSIMPEPVTERTIVNASIPFGVAIGLGTLVALYLDPNGKWAGF
jgi:prepilin peptidase CpaA